MYNTYPFLRHTFLGQTCAYYTQDCTVEAMCGWNHSGDATNVCFRKLTYAGLNTH